MNLLELSEKRSELLERLESIERERVNVVNELNEVTNELLGRLGTLAPKKVTALDKSLNECYNCGMFNTRFYNCMRCGEWRGQVHTLEDLVRCDGRKILKSRNMGKTTFMDAEDHLEELGLFFGMTDEEINIWRKEH